MILEAASAGEGALTRLAARTIAAAKRLSPMKRRLLFWREIILGPPGILPGTYIANGVPSQRCRKELILFRNLWLEVDILGNTCRVIARRRVKVAVSVFSFTRD